MCATTGSQADLEHSLDMDQLADIMARENNRIWWEYPGYYIVFLGFSLATYAFWIAVLARILRKKVLLMKAALSILIPVAIAVMIVVAIDRPQRPRFEDVTEILGSVVQLPPKTTTLEDFIAPIRSFFDPLTNALYIVTWKHPIAVLFFFCTLVLSLTFLKPLRSRGQSNAKT